MNKNQEYELFTKRLYNTLTRMHAGVQVEHNQIIGGNQIDVSWSYRLAGVDYLTIVECKNYNSSVDLNCFRQLVYNMDALKASGVLVTTVGFQAGVIQAAKERGDVSLLKVNFEVEKDAATLDFALSCVTTVRYEFDEHTSTEQQMEMLYGLYQNDKAGDLTVFRDADDETTTLRELQHYLAVGVPEGEHTTYFDGVYVRLPAPFNEAIRIASATYTVEKENFFSQLGMTLTADIVTAHVVNQLTGEEYEQVIDDDF